MQNIPITATPAPLPGNPADTTGPLTATADAPDKDPFGDFLARELLGKTASGRVRALSSGNVVNTEAAERAPGDETQMQQPGQADPFALLALPFAPPAADGGQDSTAEMGAGSGPAVRDTLSVTGAAASDTVPAEAPTPGITLRPAIPQAAAPDTGKPQSIAPSIESLAPIAIARHDGSEVTAAPFLQRPAQSEPIPESAQPVPLGPLNSTLMSHAAADIASRLEPRVGTPAWDGALSQKVVWMVTGQRQVAELHLNPPDLGPLHVVLTVSNNEASALFMSHHTAVREAVEAALPRLREMMADSGINLGNATVSADTPKGQAGFERHEHAAAGGHGKDTPPAAEPAPGRMQSLRARGDSLVDTFA